MKLCKATDLWRTPKEVFNNLDKEFNFYADMASSKANKLCELGFTESDNSLSFDWAERLYSFRPSELNQYVWCNPPYSNPLPWTKKAVEAQKNGLGVVMLLNADTSTRWFMSALPYVSEIRNITGFYQGGVWKNGRLAFIDGNGNPISGNNKAQFVLIFNPYKIGAQVTSYVSKKEIMKP